MKIFSTLAGLALLVPVATGCASRAAPFDELDKAPVTILRLGPPPAPPVAAVPTAPGAPMIPGVPPEWQAAGQQLLQGVQQALPGLIPPNLLPGAAPQVAPTAPPAPTWNGFTILASQQLADEDLKDEILDVFGDDDSFEGAGDPNNFRPGLGISFAGSAGPPVDLLVSFSSNQARMVNGTWPHMGKNMFAPDARKSMTEVYTKLFGPVPPDA